MHNKEMEENFNKNLSMHRKASTRYTKKNSTHRRKRKTTTKMIKIGPANIDNLDDSDDSDFEIRRVPSDEEGDSSFQRSAQQRSESTRKNAKMIVQEKIRKQEFESNRTESITGSHHSRGSIHNLHASPNYARNESIVTDHRNNLMEYNYKNHYNDYHHRQSNDKFS